MGHFRCVVFREDLKRKSLPSSVVLTLLDLEQHNDLKTYGTNGVRSESRHIIYFALEPVFQ